MSIPIDDIFSSCTDGLVEKILSVLGRDAVSSVFLGGSAAAGEISWVETGGRYEIYSDLDLYVVLKNPEELSRARAAAAKVSDGYPLAGDGYVFLRGPDVGVYSYEDLMGQPARPGTVDISARYRVMYGDPDIPVKTADHIDRQINPEEGLYLIENRLTELARFWRNYPPGGEDTMNRFAGFLLCKTCIDVVTSLLVGFGRYESGRGKRMDVFESMVSDGTLDDRLTTPQIDLIRTSYRVIENLPASAGALTEGIQNEKKTVTNLALEAWKMITAVCWPDKSGDWRSLITTRCRIGEYLGNSRQYLIVSSGLGIKRVISMKSVIHLARYSPRDALRLAALIDYLEDNPETSGQAARIKQSMDPFLDRLTSVCGFSQGTLAERASAMYRAIQ